MNPLRYPVGKQVLLDPSQEKVVGLSGGEYLLLAPPGCGKTHVLTERIRRAHTDGVDYGDMLCLTFTNRAARGMVERIRQNIDDRKVEQVYVGNIHRFCTHFLTDYALLPAETSIIDDDDALSIMAQFLGENEEGIATQRKRRQECFAAVQLAAMMRQIESGHPKEVRLHPECLTQDDVKALRTICDTEGMLFTPTTMATIYHDARDYEQVVKGVAYPTAMQEALLALLRKMELAHFYHTYKQDHRLMDFEDLLISTYDALTREDEFAQDEDFVPFKHYGWCQVDEVQDLNPLQLSIIDLLMAKDHTLVFLGDEQQAIFSFMGAKMSTLEQLKVRCKDSLFRLDTNHRSPRYLLDVFNTYAHRVLGISEEFLPRAEKDEVRVGNELAVVCSTTLENEYSDVAQQAQRLATQYATETTTVVVLTNADADMVSERMTQMHVPHFKVSGTDLFASMEVKMLMAQLSVMANEHNFMAWVRLLKGFHVYEQTAAARRFVRELADLALSPTDLLTREGSSYVMDFVRTYEEQTIVVFDTETTGLRLHVDDIVQIAAVKMRRGQVVEGSEFSVYVETEREIPEMLGEVVNPIIEERKHHTLLPHAVALRQFMDYVGTDVLLGHNADYDYTILRENLMRYLPEVDLETQCPTYYDSLKLTRLLFPELHQYKLKYLLSVFGLEGENSHLADDDVNATCSVVRYAYEKARDVEERQRRYLAQASVRERGATMRRRMLPIYNEVRGRLNEVQTMGEEALIAQEMRRLYLRLLDEGLVEEVKNVEYVFRYISEEMVGGDDERLLREQIADHIVEITTLRESDLCGSNVVEENIRITTVHKAKGLEFDNVVLFDAAADRYPSFFSKTQTMVDEDKRKFYVAMTRAKRRVLLTVSGEKKDFHGRSVERNITSFMRPIEQFFTSYSLADDGLVVNLQKQNNGENI